MKPLTRIAQRGGASLAVTLILVFVMMLAVAYTNRNLIFEQKTSANQYRAAQAFEAAESALEWATAQLNSNTSIDANCLASSNASDTQFRDRYVDDLRPTGALTPITYAQAGAQVALQAGCTQNGGGGWSCSCPVTGSPQFAASANEGTRLMFSVRFSAGDRPGLLKLVSSACIGGVAPCLAGHGDEGDAIAQSQVTVGHVPGLGTEPAAALTVRGSVKLDTGAFGLHHTNPASGGVTLHAAGEVKAPSLQLTSLPGAPSATSAISHDLALNSLTATGFFASVFHMDKAAWKSQGSVRRISCSVACDSLLAQTVGMNTANPLIWLDNGLRLNEPLELGTPERPVLLIVDGPVQFNAQTIIHGMIYSTGSAWNDTLGATIHGAVVLENDMQAHGSTQIHHDASILNLLHYRTGSFARLAGTWKDF